MIIAGKIDNDHRKILEILFDTIPKKEVHKIIDLGTGRTSLGYLTDRYPDKNIKALTYPGDMRKINSIKENVSGSSYELIEADLSDYKDEEKYDIVLAHLLLGEASMFAENTFEDLLKKIFEIDTEYLIIIDYKEDPAVDFKKIEDYAKEKRKIIKAAEIERENIYKNKNFTGKILKGYVIYS